VHPPPSLQVGGVLRGCKRCSSPATLPLTVEAQVLQIPPGVQATIEAHLVLVYTGTTRLAKNLLQVEHTYMSDIYTFTI